MNEPQVWHGMTTLVACQPDINRKSIDFGFRSIIQFNREMSEWTAERDADFNEILRLLRKLDARPAK